MRLEPGVTRELHWHATAAEWAFVLEGRVRTTVVDPAGGSEINDFDPGDVWYFPRGHPHSLACLGDKPCHFILIFDNGYFSEFGTFSITDWMGHASKALLAKNFGLPEATFDGFPKEEVYFAHGPVPPAEAKPLQGALKSPPETHRYRLLAQEPHSVHKYGREWRVGADRFPDFHDRHRRSPRSGTGRPARAALAPQRRRMAVRHPRPVQRHACSARTAAIAPRRWTRATSATSRKAMAIRSRTSATASCRMLIGFNTGNYQAIDLSQWIASNPSYLLANNFGKPQALFDKFPKERVFIAPPDGHGQREIK